MCFPATTTYSEVDARAARVQRLRGVGRGQRGAPAVPHAPEPVVAAGAGRRAPHALSAHAPLPRPRIHQQAAQLQALP